MWRLCKLGYRHERGLLLAAFSLALLSALPDSLLALWFKLLGDGALARNWSLVVFAAVALVFVRVGARLDARRSRAELLRRASGHSVG